MKGSTLRIPEGLELTPSLRKHIALLLNDGHYTLEYFSQTPDLLASYQQRTRSLLAAFKFLCEAIPPTHNLVEINAYLNWCEQYCDFATVINKTDISEYQTKLADYTTFLVDAVSHIWQKSADNAIELLDKAEQYLLLQKPRPQFATLIPIVDDQTFTLIVDKPLTPFTQKTLNELKLIKASPAQKPTLYDYSYEEAINDILRSNADNYVNKEDWFFYLSDDEKQLLHCALQKIDLDSPLAIFQTSRLRKAPPGLANLALHQAHLINTKLNTRQSFPARLRSSHLGARDVSKLPECIQQLHTLRNQTRLLEASKEINPDESSPLLIQTLISPFDFAMFNPLIEKWFPDHWLDEQRQFAVEKAKKIGYRPIYSTNHPFNYYARKLAWTSKHSPECLEILHAAQKHLKTITNDDAYTNAFNALVTQYEQTLNSNAIDWNGRELFLSSLGDIIISYLGGISYGSCVSGKDRKAIQLIHTNAMLLFHTLYGAWPQYTDTGEARDKFVTIFVQIYRSQHYQRFSGQNAPGSDGIKTPESYLTYDITHAPAIQDVLAQDDRLASNNEVKSIVSKENVSANPYLSVIAPLKLQEDQIRNLLALLKDIVSEQAFWQDQTTFSMRAAKAYVSSWFSLFSSKERDAITDESPKNNMPDGVIEIFNILNDIPASQPTLTPVQKLTNIYETVLNRKKDYPFRSEVTRNFYRILEILIRASVAFNPDEVFKNTMKKLTELNCTILESQSSFALNDL